MVYIVPVSGGKDSQAVLAWALLNHDRKDIRVVHQNTGFDHPLTYKHMRYMARRYSVKIEHTHSKKYEDIFDLIVKDRWFPSGQARNCTRHLKQRPFKEWLRSNFDLAKPGQVRVFMGMRPAESTQRKDRYAELDWDTIIYLPDVSSEYGVEFRHVEVTLPIVEFSTEEVFKYLADRGDKVNPLYKKGHTRVGCYPCLLTNNAEWSLAAKDPVGRVHIQKLVQIEDNFEKSKEFSRKFIKIHPTRDVRGLLKGAETSETKNETCSWCSI